MSENEGTCEAMERVEEEMQPDHDTPSIQLTGTLRQGALDLRARAESINSKVNISCLHRRMSPPPSKLLSLRKSSMHACNTCIFLDWLLFCVASILVHGGNLQH